MAIPFLNNINLDNNELQNAKLHNTGSANTNPGQIYFDTGDNLAKYYSNGADLWVDLKEYSFGNGTFVNLSTTGTTAKPIITAELSATGTPSASTFLRGDNTWATVPGENDFLTGLSFNNADGILTATVQNQSNVTVDLDGRYALTGDVPTVNDATITITAGTGLTTGGDFTTNQGTNETITINHGNTSRTDTTSTDAPSYGGTFEAVTSVTTNATGHVTAIDVSTVTLPASDDTTYDLTVPSATTNIRLSGSDATNDDVTISSTANETTVTRISATELRIGLPDDVTIAGELTVAGTGQSSFAGQVTIPQTPSADTDAASKHYVDQAVTGALSYQGGYNASTNTPDLDSSPSSSIEKGWTYTVTADGSFFTEQVRVGDVLISEVDEPSTLADWTTVQNNIDLASSTQVGIGNVIQATDDDKTGIEVGYSDGTAKVGLNIDDIALVSSLTDPSDSYVPFWNESSGENERIATEDLATELSALTSKAFTITDTDTVTHSLGRDVIIQLYDNVTFETVYADVDRISTTQATITFATTPTNSIRVLVQKIG